MKTKTQLTALFLVISMMFVANAFAMKRDIKLEEETYIDDIPFNTSYVASAAAVYEMEEEAYVDDIPFNTVLVVNYEMEDEASIDDIPFDTEAIAYNMAKELLYLCTVTE